MPLVFKRLKVYFRLTLLVALALVVVLVVYKNKTHRVDVWFFKSYESVNVLWLLVCTAVASVLSWWVITASVGVWRDMRELKRVAEIKKTRVRQQELETQLAETEKRIDKKLKDAVSREEES